VLVLRSLPALHGEMVFAITTLEVPTLWQLGATGHARSSAVDMRHDLTVATHFTLPFEQLNHWRIILVKGNYWIIVIANSDSVGIITADFPCISDVQLSFANDDFEMWRARVSRTYCIPQRIFSTGPIIS
jgi:hypothetical protein